MSLLVVGTVAFDSIRTPFGEVEEAQGGSAAYFSLAASLFTEVKLVSVVGHDFQDAHRKLFDGRPIDLSGLTVLDGETFRWSGEYHYDMNEAQTLDTRLNVLERFQAEIPKEFRSSPFVFLANIDPGLQARVLEQVEQPRLVAADTMNFWIESKRDALEQLFGRLDALVINEGEARMLGQTTNIRQAGRRILDSGVNTLVVKRGEYGVVMMDSQGGVFAAPGLPLEEVVDPTGAGDSFAGGMMGALAQQQDLSEAGLRRALVWGSVMASFTVEGFGISRLASVNHQDLEQRFEEFSRLTHFERV